MNPVIQNTALIAFELKLNDDVINPLFDKLKEVRPKKSRRYYLQMYLRKAWAEYFLQSTNYQQCGDDDEIVVVEKRVELLQDAFLEIADLICTHPNFSWNIKVGGEKIGKPNKAMITSTAFLDDLLPKSRGSLITGLRSLIEETW